MELIWTRAKQFKNNIAIHAKGQDYTFDHLSEKSDQVAAFLLDDKTHLKEDRIAFMVPPSFEYTSTQWGIWKAGGIAVPLCVLHPLPSLRYVLEDTQASRLIVHPDYEEILAPLAKELAIPLIRLKDFEGVTLKELPEIAMEQGAMILYTSGTTNLPKGVVTTHANISTQISTLVEAWQWTSKDHILNILPLHHVHGIINVMSCALWTGACCEFLPKFDARKVWEIFASSKLSLFMAVPTIYFKLIKHWDKANEEEKENWRKGFESMRLMVSGSAALPVSVLEKWKTISGHTLLERYGMTEIGMALSNLYDGERRPGHVGLPLPGVQIQLFDNEGKIPEVGTPGTIHIKGPSVFKEYWQKPEATQKAFTDDGWFISGDVAILNNGYYKILGRDSVDIIKSGGYKISALEIEEVLRTHPSIDECGVVGIPDEEWGEIVAVSLVTPEKEIDFSSISTWLKERLPAYKIPRRYIIQEDLPRNTLGKVTKNEIKKLFA